MDISFVLFLPGNSGKKLSVLEQYIENEWVKVEQKAFDIDRYIRRMQRESEILKIVQKLVIESGE